VAANVDWIRSFYDCLDLGDVPGLLALFAPEIEWTEAERFPYYGGTWRTLGAVVTGLLVPLGRDWSEFTARATDYVAEGDHVVAFGSYAGTHRRTGRSFTAPFAHRWTLREGKITGFVQYTDTAKVIEALHD
jgi:uncharacterized protein